MPQSSRIGELSGHKTHRSGSPSVSPQRLGIRERNPARTFGLSSYYFVEHFDDADASESASFWASREPLRKVVEDMWRRRPDFAGLLPISFSVAGLNTGFGVYYLQFRPVQCSSPMPLVADDEAKRAVVQDIVMLSSGSINGGIPFLPAEGSGPEGIMLALPGRSVRGQGASQTRTVLFPSWGDYRRRAHGDLCWI